MALNKLSHLFAVCAVAVALPGCGGGGGDAAVAADGSSTPPPASPTGPVNPAPSPSPNPAPPPATAAAATAPGLPIEAATSARIGAAGGSLSSADGTVRLTVPAGALSHEVTFSLQALQNEASGGRGRAWRLLPEDPGASSPLRLSMAVSESDAQGVPLSAMTLARHGPDGRWLGQRTPDIQAQTRRVEVQTTRLGDWASVAGLLLQPGRARVITGGTLDLTVVQCPLTEGSNDSHEVPLGRCDPMDKMVAQVGAWAANGQPGGSAAAGSIAALDDPIIRARYTAPARVPAANPVAVSVDIKPTWANPIPATLVAHVQVDSPVSCAWLHDTPSLEFEAEMGYRFSGSAAAGSISLQQSGLIRGRLQRVFDNDLSGVWHATTTTGFVNLADSITQGGRTSQLVGSGAPVVDSLATSGVQLVVSYVDCTYTVQAGMSVLASSGEANDPPHPTRVGSFQRGGEPIFDVRYLAGEMRIEPRPENDLVTNYAPDGAGGMMFTEGFATPGQAGSARVRWGIFPPVGG